MALDKHKGEVIGSLGPGYRVVPFAKWMDTPLPKIAVERAIKSFMKKGALLPIRFQDDDVLVQEYPQDGRLAFVFQRVVRGRVLHAPIVFKFPPETIADLRLAGRWGASN